MIYCLAWANVDSWVAEPTITRATAPEEPEKYDMTAYYTFMYLCYRQIAMMVCGTTTAIVAISEGNWLPFSCMPTELSYVKAMFIFNENTKLYSYSVAYFFHYYWICLRLSVAILQFMVFQQKQPSTHINTGKKFKLFKTQKDSEKKLKGIFCFQKSVCKVVFFWIQHNVWSQESSRFQYWLTGSFLNSDNCSWT